MEHVIEYFRYPIVKGKILFDRARGIESVLGH
jgi:hypothetical protein